MFKKAVFIITFALALNVLPYPVEADLTAGLVGYWPLDGDAEDMSGHGNHGVVNGNVTPVADRFGTADSAMNFPGGTSNYIDLGQPPMLLIKGAMTVAAWVRADTLSQTGRIIAKQGPRSARSWGLNLETAGYARFDIGVNPTDRIRVDSEPLSFGPDEWWHIAGVFRPGQAGELYINGELVKSEPTNVTTQWIENGLPINIGRRPQPGTPWSGDIDEVHMFDVALSSAEVAKLMSGGVLSFPKARGPNPQDGAIHEDTWVNLSWSPGDFAVSHDVYLGDDFNTIESATRDSDVFRGNQTLTFYVAGFPGFAYPDGLVPGTTYYWRIDEVNAPPDEIVYKGDIWSFSIPPKTAYNPDPADGAEFVGPDNVTLSWTPGFGAKLHTLYLGNDYDEVSSATIGMPAGSAAYKPGPLEREKVYYWRVDEFDGAATYEGNIWAFTTPGAAGSLQPANGAVDVGHTQILTWTPAENATSHQVFFGVDTEAVKNATTASPEYKGNKALGSESYDPGKLDWDTRYYWRVDAVYSTGTVKGLVWSFTTADFLVVDDFEGYTDDDAAGQAIWQTWIDGFGIADNGAQVGYLIPPYCEQTIVHGGVQSMPFLYANEAGVRNSEASLAVTAPHDWTAESVGELSLWFRGSSSNAAEPLYVAISNTTGSPAIVANGDANAAKAGVWTEWVVPLQAFADKGINLSNVAQLAIGLGNKGGTAAGGSGTMYIDDIRLYRP